MKNSIIIFLIAVITFPFWGSYSYFQLEKNNIRKEAECKMANNTDERLLLVLSFTREESLTMLRWKHSREFVYNGHMYDIVEQREDGNYIHYTCYKDHKETQLESKKAELIAMAMGQDPARENQSKKLTNFLKTVFSQDSFYWTPISPESSTIQFSAFNFIFSTFTPNPLHPPPKFG